MVLPSNRKHVNRGFTAYLLNGNGTVPGGGGNLPPFDLINTARAQVLDDRAPATAATTDTSSWGPEAAATAALALQLGGGYDPGTGTLPTAAEEPLIGPGTGGSTLDPNAPPVDPRGAPIGFAEQILAAAAAARANGGGGPRDARTPGGPSWLPGMDFFGAGAPMGTGGQDELAGQYDSSTMNGVVSDYQDVLLSDPTAYFNQYLASQGIDPKGGTAALGMPWAQNMPIEFFMTEAGQDPSNYHGEPLASYYDQNIAQGMTPGGGYYTPDQFFAEVGNTGSAMNNFIFDNFDAEMNPISPAQQMGNFLGAMEAVLGGSMNEEMMTQIANQYVAAFKAYEQAVITDQGNGQGYQGSLEQWLADQGLLPTP